MKMLEDAVARLKELGFVAQVSAAKDRLTGGMELDGEPPLQVYIHGFIIYPETAGWHVGISASGAFDDEHLVVPTLEEAVAAVHRLAIKRGWLETNSQ